jgi:hypothetical protein
VGMPRQCGVRWNRDLEDRDFRPTRRIGTVRRAVPRRLGINDGFNCDRRLVLRVTAPTMRDEAFPRGRRVE